MRLYSFREYGSSDYLKQLMKIKLANFKLFSRSPPLMVLTSYQLPLVNPGIKLTLKLILKSCNHLQLHLQGRLHAQHKMP
jgi:hypothetical protein